jgi:hypothetical protein
MIRSNLFGGVTLTGDDADKFERQVRHGRAPKSAQRALQNGDLLLQQFGVGSLKMATRTSSVTMIERSGHVSIAPDRSKRSEYG